MTTSRSKISTIFMQVLPPLAVLTLAIFAAYSVARQTLRMSADDPQVQLAEDVSAALGSGKKPVDLLGDSPTVDLGKSLATFVVIYDTEGRPLASNARLDGAMPALQKGVLNAAKISGQSRVTWEPRKGLRYATVVATFVHPGTDAGYVVAGRSLREVENRYQNIGSISLATWLVGLLFLIGFFGWLQPQYIASRLSNKL